MNNAMQEMSAAQREQASGRCVRVMIGKSRGFVTLAPPTQMIRTGDKVWYFEWHQYFGPTHTNKDGDPYAAQPSVKSVFWHAVGCWHSQGCRIDAEGFAQWDDVRENIGPLRLRRVGRHWKLVPDDASPATPSGEVPSSVTSINNND